LPVETVPLIVVCSPYTTIGEATPSVTEGGGPFTVTVPEIDGFSASWKLNLPAPLNVYE